MTRRDSLVCVVCVVTALALAIAAVHILAGPATSRTSAQRVMSASGAGSVAVGAGPTSGAPLGRRSVSPSAQAGTGEANGLGSLITHQPQAAGSTPARVGAPLRYGPWRTSRMTFYAWGQYGWPVSARRYPGGGSGYFACGGRYLKTTMGVAHKTLPCGTLVQLRYKGRSITVPVVDRGPYGAGMEFDLTSAACMALLDYGTKCYTFTAQWRIVR